MKEKIDKNLLRDSYDYDDYDKNVVVLSEEDLIDLNLMDKYLSVSKKCGCKTSSGGGGCCKTSSSGGGCCKTSGEKGGCCKTKKN